MVYDSTSQEYATHFKYKEELPVLH